MKKLLFSSLLVFLCSTSAYTETLDTLAPEDIDRILVLKASPLDALKCGDKLIGDHVSNASVYRVVSSTETKVALFYEIVDGNDVATICNEPVTILRNYFPNMTDFKKQKKVDRVLNLEGNSISCYLDETNQIPDSLKNLPHLLDIHKIYGRRDLSPNGGEEEIKYILKDEKDKVYAKCNSVKYNSQNRNRDELSLDKTDKQEFDKKIDEAILFLDTIGPKIIENRNQTSGYYVVNKNFNLGHCNLFLQVYSGGTVNSSLSFNLKLSTFARNTKLMEVQKSYGPNQSTKETYENAVLSFKANYEKCFVTNTQGY